MLSVKFSRAGVHYAMISSPAGRARQPCYIIRSVGGRPAKVSEFEANWRPCIKNNGVFEKSLKILVFVGFFFSKAVGPALNPHVKHLIKKLSKQIGYNISCYKLRKTLHILEQNGVLRCLS